MAQTARLAAGVTFTIKRKQLGWSAYLACKKSDRQQVPFLVATMALIRREQLGWSASTKHKKLKGNST
jgi:hypothetical protein